MKDRIAAEAQRIKARPSGMRVLSWEDVDNFAPLTTPAGRDAIEREIKAMGGVDLIIFDNIMSLVGGDMKEEESWRKVLPWIKSLTKRSIAQIWIHHTGHDESHGYGTKTREWQMDTVVRFETVERSDTDVSFRLTFDKARERELANRSDFEDARVALVNNEWIWESTAGRREQKLSPMGRKVYDALCSVCNQTMYGHPATTIEAWRERCFGWGLLDRGRTEASNRTSFYKYRMELVTKNWVSCDETMAWTMGPTTTEPDEVVF
jgi:hypothetical protein